ncbi:hypothetical protein HY486_02620 [Candidatus Woesearchaeota archaeon]|nr:hypothetical protein [Candidatus Woesearchaeota archaeon]
MNASTAELTTEYINEHPDLKRCLKKGVINYSALARRISIELAMTKKTSKEAILIATRRFYEKLKNEASHEELIKKIIHNSELEIKNKTAVVILEKNAKTEELIEIHKLVRKDSGTFILLEGSASVTIIIPEKHLKLLTEKYRDAILKCHSNLALINIKSSATIERTVGVISYLTDLFAEHGINIVELLSCWKDNIFVIATTDVEKTMKFLRF